MKRLIKSMKGAVNMTGALVSVVFAVALLPVIAVQIAGTTNLTATETTLLGLVTLFLVLGLIVGIAKSSGVLKGGV